MAPEMAAGEDYSGPTLDVYGLGAILYEALTGRAPFVGVDALLVLAQVRFLDPVNPRRVQPGVPHDLETICLHCLHKAPRRRYASAEALADDLRRFSAGEPIRARRPGRLKRTWTWVKRNRALAFYLALACCSAAAIVVLLIQNTQEAVSHARDMETARARPSGRRRRPCGPERRPGMRKGGRRTARPAPSPPGGAATRWPPNCGSPAPWRRARKAASIRGCSRWCRRCDWPLPTRSSSRFVASCGSTWPPGARQTARLCFAFRLPGKMPPGPAAGARSLQRMGFISAASEKDVLVTIGPDRHVRTWSFTDGKAIGRPFRVDGRWGEQRPFSVSADGRFLATQGPKAIVFDLATGEPCMTGFQHNSGPRPSQGTYLLFTGDRRGACDHRDEPGRLGDVLLLRRDGRSGSCP